MRAGMRPLLPQADLQGAEGAQSHAAMRGWAELQPPPQSRPEGRADLRFLNIGSRVAGQGSNVVLPLPAGMHLFLSPLVSSSNGGSAPLGSQGDPGLPDAAVSVHREWPGAEFCSAACAWHHDSCARPKEAWPLIEPRIIICQSVKLVRHCLHLAAVLNFSRLNSGDTESPRPRQDRRDKDEGDANDQR